MLGIRLDKIMEERLSHLCRETGRTKTFYAKQALQEFLDEREDQLLAIARLESNEPVLEHTAFWKQIELDS